jgi:hypothetical protein
MDNMDGASSTIASFSALGAAVLAISLGDPVLGALALGPVGACLGFLPYNLARPSARIFLGDGGSMPIGFVVAAASMALPLGGEAGWHQAARRGGSSRPAHTGHQPCHGLAPPCGHLVAAGRNRPSHPPSASPAPLGSCRRARAGWGAGTALPDRVRRDRTWRALGPGRMGHSGGRRRRRGGDAGAGRVASSALVRVVRGRGRGDVGQGSPGDGL